MLRAVLSPVLFAAGWSDLLGMLEAAINVGYLITVLPQVGRITAVRLHVENCTSRFKE